MSDCKKMSHKKWRALQKKLKRKGKRQADAAARDELLREEEEGNNDSPTYLASLIQNETKASQKEEEEEELERRKQHILWVEREHRALLEIAAKKEREANEKKRREEEEQRIREEWELQQKQEEEEEKKRQTEKQERMKIEDERKKQQKDLLKEATCNEKSSDGDNWHNPIAPPSYREGNIARCPFFQRTGACRFGDRCSRAHEKPDLSCTILVPGMYSHYELEQSLLDEYDTDLSLEYEDSELYRSFIEFYQDVLPEFKSVGHIIQFKVCCNHEPHLRGNVYVQYSREEDAQNAFMKFNGRWYAGKQLSCEFTSVNKWQSAICGLFYKKKCPKGKNCNFLHVFKNPRNEFWEADRDHHTSQWSQRSWSVRSRRSRSPSYRRRRSRSPSSRSDRHRTRSPSSRSKRHGSSSYSSRRQESRHRSRSPKNSRKHSGRSKSRSPRRASHRKSRSRSGSPSRKKPAADKTSHSSPKLQTEDEQAKDKVSRKPVSFSLKLPAKQKETHLKVESTSVWTESDGEEDQTGDLENAQRKSPVILPSENGEDNNRSTAEKKHKHKKKKKHKSKKRHSEQEEIDKEH